MDDLFAGGFWWKEVWYSVRDNGWGSAGKPLKFKPRPPMPPAVAHKKKSAGTLDSPAVV